MLHIFINERVVKNLTSSEAIALQNTRTLCALLAAYGVHKLTLYR